MVSSLSCSVSGPVRARASSERIWMHAVYSLRGVPDPYPPRWLTPGRRKDASPRVRRSVMIAAAAPATIDASRSDGSWRGYRWNACVLDGRQVLIDAVAIITERSALLGAVPNMLAPAFGVVLGPLNLRRGACTKLSMLRPPFLWGSTRKVLKAHGLLR